jgi:hypothetical protein
MRHQEESKELEGVAQVVEHLPGKCNALSSNHITTKKKKKKKKKKGSCLSWSSNQHYIYTYFGSLRELVLLRPRM